MEVEEIQTQGSKFPRIRNDRISDFNKIGGSNGDDKYHDEDEEGLAGKRNALDSELVTAGTLERFCGWPASRIVRVSRASGGKDRHSKVWTSKGLRDRRVRLSVHTAIQFYDLQDRLGYDQPSKAVEWLLKAAAKSIDELPSINTTFADTPNQLSDERRSSGGTQQVPDSAELEMDTDANDLTLLHHQEQQHGSLSKSGCSSTSETSKGSGLSLSRSENRIKARERAKERRAERERERDGDSHIPAPNHLDANPLSQSSFTELLTGCHNNNNGSYGEGTNLFYKPRQWPSSPMDYFSMPQSMSALQFSVGGEHHHQHQELQHLSLLAEHMIPVVTAAAGNGNGVDYNLNFTMSSSSSLAGMNRGTLQSNSPFSLLSHHLQRLSPLEGSSAPSLIGTTAPNSTPMEIHHHQQHHQFPAGLVGRLQLCYNGDGGHLDHKGKGKN